VIQAKIRNVFKVVDTCGVHNLHGMPGLLGGLAAILVIPGIAKAQLIGIAVTVTLALMGGLIAGFLLRATGNKLKIYEDHEEFIQTEQKGTVIED